MPQDATAAAAQATVVLAEVKTSLERELIEEWLQTEEFAETGPTQLISLSAEAVAEDIAHRDDDPIVLPVRVLWLPKERNGVRRAGVKDLVTLNNPRNPNRIAQRWIAQRHPDRHRVLTGEPALLSELRQRHFAASGAHTQDAFARFIVRSAVLALARAERAIIGDRYKVPRLVVEEIMDTPSFRAQLDSIATKTGITKDEAYKRADDDLRELVATQSRLVSDLFSQAMAPVHKRAWTVHADEGGLEELRRLNRKYPLVFLPSHRSYVDAFVLGDILAHNDFPPNHLIGGANLNFWPMGSIARRTGTIFIRRSFGDDEIYRAVVQEYFAYLLGKRFNMEWYFEGGRTRTGKLRPPKYGLLNYLAEAVRGRRVEDAMLVPVAITYERLNELGAIADEQQGGKKKSEGLAWMAQYIKSQQNSAGHVYVRFGKPLSTRERLAEHGDPFADHVHDANDDMSDADLAATRRAVQKLAFDIAVGINDVTPISANALVTLALLGVRGRALTVPEIGAAIDPIMTYINARDIPQGEVGVLTNRVGLTGVLDRLALAKVVTSYTGGEQSVYSIEPGQHLIAAFYRNSAIHWFVNRSILELGIVASNQAESLDDTVVNGWDHAKKIRDLLKFEFFFPDQDVWQEQMQQELLAIEPGFPQVRPTPQQLQDALVESGFMMAHRVLRAFLGAQLVVAERLAVREPEWEIDKDEFLAECVRVGRQMLLQTRLQSPESVSSELFASAYKLAANRNLLGPGGPELREQRTAFAHELRYLGELIDQIENLDPSNRRAW